ncbi:unnamed protein product [Musa banksii]
MDAGVEVCMTADEEKQQHMDASAPLPHCRESSRRSNPGVPNLSTYGSSCSFVGLILLIPFPHFPCMACQWAPDSAPRSRRAPPRGSISTASVRLGSGPGCLPHHRRGHAVEPRRSLVRALMEWEEGHCHIRHLTHCSCCRVGGIAGVRPRIRFREPASTTSKKQDIMGVFLLWPRTPFPLHPPPLPSSCFCYMAMVAGGSQRRRVLLVEDNEVNRVVVRRLTREMGMGLEEAENGRVAVELIRQGRAYDLILMDKEMPVMDGHEATRQLRSLGVTTPIVALSGNTLQSDRDSFLEAGADHFEAKPLSRGQFMKILTKYGLRQL